MNTAIKCTAIVAVIVAGLMVFTACHRHGTRHHTGGQNPGRLADHIAAELELDQDQKGQLTAMLTDLDKKRSGLHDRARLYEVFTSELVKEEMDTERLRRVTNDTIRELDAFSKWLVSDLAAFHSALTSEQKQRLAQLLEKQPQWRYRSGRHLDK